MGRLRAPRAALSGGLGTAFRRGILQGSRWWTAVFVGRLATRGIGAVVRRRPGAVEWSETLRPGDSLTIRNRSAEPSRDGQ